MEFTIRNACAVCATVAGAADDFVHKSYEDAEIIVVDEAARLPEYQWWPLLAFYPKAIGKVMVGDPNHLRPWTGGDKENQEIEKSIPSAAGNVSPRATPIRWFGVGLFQDTIPRLAGDWGHLQQSWLRFATRG